MRIDRVKIATELARKDMKMQQVSRITGISKSYLSNVRNGLKCSEAACRKIADAIGVPVEAIIESKE